MTTISKILQGKQTVFSLKDFQILFGENNYNNLKSKINYYIKKDYLMRIRRGIFVKEDFDIFELACKIYTPSYISFETVLQKENVIFQYDSTIYLASYVSRLITIPYQGKIIKIQYRKIKDEIFYNQKGIQKNKYYSIATKQRAIEDMNYIKPNFYFDKTNENK